MKYCILLSILPFVYCEVAYTLVSTTPEPELPPRPYAFGYAAGRFPGHIDRTHSEISDGSGIVKGTFSYVDPKYKIRTVDYIADKQGFHPVLSDNPPPLPADTPVVAAAKERHFQQYSAIANSHQSAPGVVAVPADSVAVHKAKARHFDLYQKIAAQHAQLAAELQAQELAAAATADPNHIEDQH
ncbi:hypothetical protein ILUMI_22803 [Ignelater luminosus]|uniref:Uncharacterized protein n=1 Tax=Ignelater luminosus TaxID=2038154 RepID=A0A8K0C9X7_IGNLU|nr:hypothetical protein ILUMI_22803 [Ignelater luminosus]